MSQTPAPVDPVLGLVSGRRHHAHSGIMPTAREGETKADGLGYVSLPARFIYAAIILDNWSRLPAVGQRRVRREPPR